jgi:hypothetical protein
VRKLWETEEQFWGLLGHASNGCWEWPYSTWSTGYGQSTHRGKQRGTHHIAWEFANGPRPKGAWVLHRCDNRLCCNPDHLFLGTRQDNVDDMMKKGRNRQPRYVPAEIVEAIRSAPDVVGIGRRLSREHGVSPAHVSRIRNSVRRVHG